MEYFKVLVVHRQESMREEIKSILEKFDLFYRGFTCGIDGLHAAKFEHFDLILCGTDLPLITGFEMVRAIRNLSRNSLTPVILISDHLITREQALSRQLKVLGITGSQNIAANIHYILEHTAAAEIYQEEKPWTQTAYN
jgi:CheY-like chemotaxis protein